MQIAQTFKNQIFLLATSALLPLSAGTSWSNAQDLSLPGKDATAVQVGVGETKQCSSIWSRYDGIKFCLESSFAKMGGRWSTPTPISQGTTHAFFGSVGLDTNDNPQVVWAQSPLSGQASQIYFSAGNEKGRWSNPLMLSSAAPSLRGATRPKIALDDKGFTMVIWQEDIGGHWSIRATSSKNGKNWSPSEQISLTPFAENNKCNPEIVLNGKDRALAAWVNTDVRCIEIAWWKKNGGWSTPIVLSQTANAISTPKIALDDFGRGVVIWTRNDGQNHIVQASASDINGRFQPPVNISAPGQDSHQASITIDSAGNIAAIWQRYDGTNTIVQVATRDAGTPPKNWSAPFDLSTLGQDASDPQLYVNKNRLLVALWKKSDGANFIIQASTKKPGALWTPAVSLSAPGQDAISPQGGVDPAGNVVALWERSDGQSSIIQGTFGHSK